MVQMILVHSMSADRIMIQYGTKWYKYKAWPPNPCIQTLLVPQAIWNDIQKHLITSLAFIGITLASVSCPNVAIWHKVYTRARHVTSNPYMQNFKRYNLFLLALRSTLPAWWDNRQTASWTRNSHVINTLAILAFCCRDWCPWMGRCHPNVFPRAWHPGWARCATYLVCYWWCIP